MLFRSKNLGNLDVQAFDHQKVSIKQFSSEEQRHIVFKDVVEGKEHHTTVLDAAITPNYQNVIGFFAQSIMKELRLFGCFDVLFAKLKVFIRDELFTEPIQLEDLNVLRNLSELEVKKTIIETFKKKINELTVQDVGDTEVKNYIKVSQARPFVVTSQESLRPKKSVFNKIVGDSGFELEFADFLEGAPDVVSYAKNYQEIHFKIDYKTSTGTIANYYPDFFVKLEDKTVYIVETKGREDLDDIEKIKRLKQWCEDANDRQKKIRYEMLYVKQEDWERYKPKTFGDLIAGFTEQE